MRKKLSKCHPELLMEGHVSCGAYKKKPTPNANYGDENCYRAYSHQGCRTVIEATAGNKQLLEVRHFKHSQKMANKLRASVARTCFSLNTMALPHSLPHCLIATLCPGVFVNHLVNQ